MKYYIYHIPGVKIGCTKQLQKRMTDQGFTNWEILEEHSDGWLAGDREIELQKEYGYPVDKSHYMISLQNRPKWNNSTRRYLTKEDCRRGGKALKGKPKAAKYKTTKHTAPATEASMRRILCEHCNKDANTGNYSRWHGDNCKKKGPTN